MSGIAPPSWNGPSKIMMSILAIAAIVSSIAAVSGYMSATIAPLQLQINSLEIKTNRLEDQTAKDLDDLRKSVNVEGGLSVKALSEIVMVLSERLEKIEVQRLKDAEFRGRQIEINEELRRNRK